MVAYIRTKTLHDGALCLVSTSWAIMVAYIRTKTYMVVFYILYVWFPHRSGVYQYKDHTHFLVRQSTHICSLWPFSVNQNHSWKQPLSSLPNFFLQCQIKLQSYFTHLNPHCDRRSKNDSQFSAISVRRSKQPQAFFSQSGLDCAMIRAVQANRFICYP